MIDSEKKQIIIVWNITDIQQYASEDFQISLTDDEAMAILIAVEHDCDPRLGIAWSSFDYHILKYQRKDNERYLHYETA